MFHLKLNRGGTRHQCEPPQESRVFARVTYSSGGHVRARLSFVGFNERMRDCSLGAPPHVAAGEVNVSPRNVQKKSPRPHFPRDGQIP